MAFLDKLGNIAKTATDKTGDFIRTASDRTSDMLEINKIKSKISGVERSIADEKFKLGDYIYAQSRQGLQLDEQAGGICAAIQSAEGEIAAMQAQIEAIQAENEAERSQPAPAQEQVCASCGAKLAEGQKFCPSCGTPAPAPAPEPAPVRGAFCPACGVELAPGVKFCGVCGAKIG